MLISGKTLLEQSKMIRRTGFRQPNHINETICSPLPVNRLQTLELVPLGGRCDPLLDGETTASVRTYCR